MAAHKPPVTFLEKIQLKIKEKKAWAMPVLWIVVVACIGILLYLIYLRTTLPDPETIITRQIKESTKVYDRTGEVLLYDIYDSEKRTIISWNEIPQTLRDAVISSEDSKFYEHRGIDFRGIIRAIIRDIQNTEFAEGGSTITQQLVKNALLGGQKKISRKLREIMLSVEIERRFSKDEILWMYLNQIPWGSTAYGAEAASQLYFGKKAADLTLNESAILAAR
ncbi:MAG: biosynthetic peptidoglycan transglycosylase, partial [Patescibacteria group bacterium]